jgi:hypothetical protein
VSDGKRKTKPGARKASGAAPPGGGGAAGPLGARDFYFRQRGLPEDDFLPDYARNSREQEQPRQGAHMSPATKATKKTKSAKRSKGPERRAGTTAAADTGGLDELVRGGALGTTAKAAEKQLAKAARPVTGPGPAKGPMLAPAFTLTITGISTNSQAGAQNAFLLNGDALTLVINIAVTQDIINAGHHFTAHFQIIEFATNNVKSDVVTANSAFSWGPNFWISRGNNWGPASSDYTTPAKWGLTAGLYFFRATVEVLGIGAFAASQELPFRVR